MTFATFATLHADGTAVANVATTYGEQLACVLHTTPLYEYPDNQQQQVHKS